MTEPADADREAIHREIEVARAQFHALLAGATAEDLTRRSTGTRWTNEQLLFHMLFGYLIVATLLPLVRLFSRVPPGASRLFAQGLNATGAPFHLINYVGSCAGAIVFNHDRMGTKLDSVTTALERRLDAETPADLARGMSFPTRWDPYFKDWMSLADVYHYATVHFEAHRGQLTINP